MEDNNIFGGFEAVVASISNDSDGPVTKIKAAGDDPIIDPKLLEKNDPIVEPPAEKDKDGDEPPVDPKNPEDDEPPVDPKDKDLDPPTDPRDKDSEPAPIAELAEAEEEIAEFVQEKIYEKFGFDMGDEKFSSMEDVADFVQAMVEENSKPEFSTNEVKAIDDYVRAGGDLKTYMDTVYGGSDVSSVDIDSESDQKRIVAEDLRNKGYTENRIKRALDRYEDAGTLKEEAEDALEELKEYNDKISERLLEEQEKAQRDAAARQQKYVKGVENAILEMDNIRGIDISNAEKKSLMEYIFKPTADGISQYQKDYLKNNKNLIESAYFTMKGDKLINKVQQKANSNAAKKLQARLANKGRRGKDQQAQTGTKGMDAWGAVSRQLMNNPFK